MPGAIQLKFLAVNRYSFYEKKIPINKFSAEIYCLLKTKIKSKLKMPMTNPSKKKKKKDMLTNVHHCLKHLQSFSVIQ